MPMLMGLTLDMKMGKSRPAEHCFSPFNILFRAPDIHTENAATQDNAMNQNSQELL